MSIASSPPLCLHHLLLELLQRQVQQEDRDRQELEAGENTSRQAVLERHEQLRSKYLHGVKTERARITQVQSDRIDQRAADEAREEIRQKFSQTPLVLDRARTPWEAALSHLFVAMKATIRDESDPKEKLAWQYDVLRTSAEDDLREYLFRVHLEGVQEPSRLSAELARLDGEGFGDRLAEQLRQDFPDEMREIIASVREWLPTSKKRAKPGRPPKRRTKEEKKIIDAWDSKRYKTYKALATESGVSEEVIRRVINTESKRRTRESKAE
jgi:hypothetical protein